MPNNQLISPYCTLRRCSSLVFQHRIANRGVRCDARDTHLTSTTVRICGPAGYHVLQAVCLVLQRAFFPHHTFCIFYSQLYFFFFITPVSLNILSVLGVERPSTAPLLEQTPHCCFHGFSCEFTHWAVIMVVVRRQKWEVVLHSKTCDSSAIIKCYRVFSKLRTDGDSSMT